MTMYLSNADIRPTGFEPAEFIEPPTIPLEPDRERRTTELDVDEESRVP